MKYYITLTQSFLIDAKDDTEREEKSIQLMNSTGHHLASKHSVREVLLSEDYTVDPKGEDFKRVSDKTRKAILEQESNKTKSTFLGPERVGIISS